MDELLATLKRDLASHPDQIIWWEVELVAREGVAFRWAGMPGASRVRCRVRCRVGEWVVASKLPHGSWESMEGSSFLLESLPLAERVLVYRQVPVPRRVIPSRIDEVLV